MIMDKIEEIRKSIERSVTHLARTHGATDDVVWKQMLLAAAKHAKVIRMQAL